MRCNQRREPSYPVKTPSYNHHRKRSDNHHRPHIPSSGSGLDQLKVLAIINQALDSRWLALQDSSLLLWAFVLLLASQHRSLAIVVKNLIFSLDNLLSLLGDPLLLRNLNEIAKLYLSASGRGAWTLVIEAVQDIGVADGSLDWRVCVIGMLWKKLEERFRENRGGVIVGIDKGICLVQLTSLVVVAVGLGDLVGMGLARQTPLLHGTDFRALGLAAASELVVPVNTNARAGSRAIAPFLVVLLVTLEAEAGRSNILMVESIRHS